MRELAYRLRVLVPSWMLKLCFVILLCGFVFLALPFLPGVKSSPFGMKLNAFKEAVQWEVRAFKHSEDGFIALISGGSTYKPENETGGMLLGVTKEGNLVIDTYIDEKNIEAVLADLIIDDPAGVARYLKQYKFQHVLLDTYTEKEQALHIVRLRDGTPLNLLLIQENLAHAHPNPPTSIVDRMMATYWWKVFNGEIYHYESI